MKKKMIALLAGALMSVAMSGSAFAYFGSATGNQFDLVRVVYDTTGSVEVATDLGNVATVAGNLAPAFSLSQFGAGKTFADLNVAYFAYDTTTNTFWGTSTVAPAGMTTTLVTGAEQAAAQVGSLYNTFGSQTVVGTTTAATSYYGQMDKAGAAIGTLAGLLTPATGEQSLAALATGGSASMELYKFSFTGAGHNLVLTTTDAMTITTNADGTTTVSSTPIPAAAYLLGSGLMGLFGLRRKQRA